MFSFGATGFGYRVWLLNVYSSLVFGVGPLGLWGIEKYYFKAQPPQSLPAEPLQNPSRNSKPSILLSPPLPCSYVMYISVLYVINIYIYIYIYIYICAYVCVGMCIYKCIL